jgi:ribosome-binding factor A
MAIRKISRKDLQALCSDVGSEDGLDPRDEPRSHPAPQIPRKTLQLCSQVTRTLTSVLAESGDDLLRDLTVVSVAPAPSSARLLVTVALAPWADPANLDPAAGRLEYARGRLRTEVAAAVRRRRAPDLVFRIVTA